jgi:hypothetical protein
MKPFPEDIIESRQLAKKMDINIFNCPLFLSEIHGVPEEINEINKKYGGLRPHELWSLTDHLYELLLEGTYVMPFNQMRVIYGHICNHQPGEKHNKEHDQKIFMYLHKRVCEKTGKNSIFYIAQYMNRNSNGASFAMTLRPHPLQDRKGFISINGFTDVSSRKPEIIDEEKIKIHDMQLGFHRNPYPPEVERAIALASRNYITFIYMSISLFASIAKKDNRLVEVRPGPNTREVKWLQSKEHYVILNSHQAVKNCSMPQEKSELKLKSSDIITRSAHNRRAHTRKLRSPFWKNKIGSTIFVKETWVGPKEWMDKSQSRYRVIFDNNNVSNNYATKQQTTINK